MTGGAQLGYSLRNRREQLHLAPITVMSYSSDRLFGRLCWPPSGGNVLAEKANTKAQMISGQTITITGVQAGLSASLEGGPTVKEESARLRAELPTSATPPEIRICAARS